MDSIDLAEVLPFGIGHWSSAGELFSRLVPFAFGIAALAIFIYLISGAVRWILSGGNKDAIAAARGSIVNAIIGFIMLIFLLLVINYLLPAVGYTGKII